MTIPSCLLENRAVLEGAVVFSYYQQPELLAEYPLDVETDLQTQEGKLLYRLAKQLHDGGVQVFDLMSLETALVPYPKVREALEGFGGIRRILKEASVVNPKNMEKHYDDLLKANLLISFHNQGVDVLTEYDKLKRLPNSQAVYDYIEYKILSCASDKVSKEITVNELFISDELIEQIIAGELIETLAFPKFAPRLNNILNGAVLGKLHLFAAPSGAGKSTFVLSNLLYPLIDSGEKVCIISNELTFQEYLLMLMVIVLTDKFDNYKLTREKLTKKDEHGRSRLTAQDIQQLKECQAYINQSLRKQMYFINFSDADVSNVIKMIRKYSKLGVKCFVYDTMKADNSASDRAWASLVEHSKTLTFTAQKNNVALYLTCQTSPSLYEKRWLNRSQLSESKGIVFMAHSLVMMRPLRNDEFAGDKFDVKPYEKVKDENGKWTTAPIILGEEERSSKYVLVFIDKNRSGAEGECLLYKFYGNNARYREIGYARPRMDS